MSIRHLAVLFLLSTGAASAQDTASAPGAATDKAEAPAASTGLIAYLKRTVQLTGSVRARLESTQGANFSTTPAEAYLLSRVRLGIGFKPFSWFRSYVEAQDARAYNYKVTPPTSVDDPFDLRQAYVEVGAVEGNGVKLRAGRQDVTLGSGRLVGTSDWSNTAKNYDVIRGYVTTGSFKMDVLGGSQVLIDPTRLDRSKPGEHFYGAYTAFSKLLPGGSVEPYLFTKTALNVKGKDTVLGNADTIYVGGRVIGQVHGGFDYTYEGVREAGSYADDSVRAWGYVGGGGWTIPNVGWKLHLNSDYLYGSGDSGKKDGVHESFDNLYGLNQPLNSLTGLFSWRNAEQWRAGVDFVPYKKLKVKIDFRDYWLATVRDGLYNSSGTRTVLNAKATSNHIGDGVDALFSYALSPKSTFVLGIGNLSPGPYLKESGKTSGYIYPTFSFSRQL
jgi:hypothetical protein